MSIFHPQYDFHRIEEIPCSFFTEHGIKALLLDVDNTLTADNSQELRSAVQEWLTAQKEAGLHLFVLSNNSEERVAPFAKAIGLDYIAKAGKPLTRHVRGRLKAFGVTPQQTALIGDQLFTDILCGNLSGCLSVLVEPYAEEGYGFFRIKRLLEKPILRRYYKKKGDVQ